MADVKDGHLGYRIEDDEQVVDVRVEAVDQLFDRRDPAPFHDRDLDPNLVEYLRDASEDLAAHRFRVVFWIKEPCGQAEIEQAYRAHFARELERVRRRRRQHRQVGEISLVLAVVLLVAVQMAAQILGRVFPGTIGTGLKEGLVIASWVVMWRPLEVLVYDWIPFRNERRVVAQLLGAAVQVRAG